MKRTNGMSQTSTRNNVIDFSKRKRDLSHIRGPKPKKKERKFKFQYVKYISFLILLLLLSASLYTFVNSQYAVLQDLTVEGNFLLEKQEILDNLPKIGQANFYRTSSNHYIEVLKENPWIYSADVSKDYISRTVEIHIEERRPLFRTITDSEVNIISEDGKVLPDRTGISGTNVPFVIGSEEQSDLLKVIEQLKEVPDIFLNSLSEINIENINSVNIYTTEGFIIRVGPMENLTYEKTNEIIKIIQLESSRNNKGTIDIRGHNIIFTSNLEG